MSNGYRLIFWGLLFILIDLRLGPLDILPDFIGYIFILNGIKSLSARETLFEKARPLAMLLIVLAFPNFMGAWEINLTEGPIAVFPMVYQFVLSILHLLLIYFIFDATYRYAKENRDEFWAKAARVRWNYYAVIHLIYLALNSFMFNVSFNVFQAVYILIMITILIIEIVIIVFMKKSEARSNLWGSSVDDD